VYPNPQDAFPLPPRANLEQYKKLAKELAQACRADDPAAFREWATNWIAKLLRLTEQEGARAIDNDSAADQFEQFVRREAAASKKFSLTQAQFVIARAHGFESWPKLAKHISAMSGTSSAVAEFERAADAIVAGDLPALETFLRANPDLIHQRSTREHGATLLHYVSANGVENYRQRTPKNIAVIAERLLKAGADVNAAANVYGGGSTALSLVATSVHPERAGVQEQLMDVLLRHGAIIDRAVAPNDTHGRIVNACLANGRGRAAAFLATRGAEIDLEGAAGVGNLDAVKTFFRGKTLAAGATKPQMERGFLWACEYGHISVIEFLLERGASLLSQADTGLTALHWAVVGGQVETIRLLLARGASLETRNAYDGDALGQAFWSAVNDDSGTDHVPTIEILLEAGARIEDGTLAWIDRQKKVSPALKSRLTDVLRRRGAKS
jgi:ankyrin repeat protein